MVPLMTAKTTRDELLDRVRSRKRLPEPSARRMIREGAFLSQQDMANALGVSRQCLSKWEAGDRVPRPPHLEAYVQLLEALRSEVVA